MKSLEFAFEINWPLLLCRKGAGIRVTRAGEPDLEKRTEIDNLSIVVPQIFLIFRRLYFGILKLYYLHFQPAYYQFGYQVDTLDTGDYHGHMEQLDGNVKRGKY